MAYEISEQKKIGIGLIGFGFFFSFLGIILFFDRGLLALGNIFCLLGIVLLLGWQSTWRLFSIKNNCKGSVSFLLGLFLIFVRWPIAGIIIEIFGSVSLFSGFWPSIKIFLFQVPVLGWILQYPFLVFFFFYSFYRSKIGNEIFFIILLIDSSLRFIPQKRM
ncbi:hypothetical protein NE237_011480 [Protea cynaroides]|uniref:Vesicle transport protein GOT1 n=1 Tax=Protea cynaroides TaxID=273540 RepID=A0A9Q0GV13_9MAGN|nr:hypothetical protein NE237_011480 [Protea cynaroides]